MPQSNSPDSNRHPSMTQPKSIISTRNQYQQHQQQQQSLGSSLARSFVYSSFKPSYSPINESLQVHTPDSIHEYSADLAGIGVPDADIELDEDAIIDTENNTGEVSRYIPNAEPRECRPEEETTPLFPYDDDEDDSTNYTTMLTDLEALKTQEDRVSVNDIVRFVKEADAQQWLNACVLGPAHYLPSVFLGTLLNVLDGVSYGMIIFPLGEAVFSNLGPTGLSMFYVSTILCQLVFSLGGSAFKSGVGSEMIEVTPFFHQMATSIMVKLQSESENGSIDVNKKIITTTIFTYAISSIITGLCFGLLGRCKLGKLVGFFPRHILVGCIGGVGYFLVVTGIEVSSRLEGGISYNIPTLEYLIEPLPFIQWVIPLVLAAILVLIQRVNRNPLVVPAFLVLIFVLFHVLVAVVPTWNLDKARDYGWVFASESSNEKWYAFYEYYDFKLCDWWLVLHQTPTMLALTFFGVLHVPINVPAFALTTGMDTYDVDRELMAHGVSNFVSGLFGAIPNYLVYTNSVLFFRSGADSRLSGVMLAIATTGIMFIGPVLIGYIPVTVVGLLIYLLGYELLKESIWDTFGRLRKFEYATIIIIVITMGAWDFVYGILVGILLACVSFVIEAGRKPVISEIYTGEYARSIVVRHPKQIEFLKDVGNQICVLKLSGSLFFGSIGGLEDKIRAMFELANYKRQPIRYLILDLNDVTTFDFSATEGFKRIRNLLMERNCYFILSSIEDKSCNIVESLKFCGLWETEEHTEKIQMFNTLNSALEWCENKFLENYRQIITRPQESIAVNTGNNGYGSISPIIGTPRQVQFIKAARKHKLDEMKEQDQILRKLNGVTERRVSMSNMKQPLYLILQVMQGLSKRTEESFWIKLLPYLKRVQFKKGDIIYEKGVHDPTVFMIESGLVDFKIEFNDLKFSISSSELPLTMFGDIAIVNSNRRIKYMANTMTVVWVLDYTSIEKLQRDNSEIYEELLLVFLRLTTQRMESVTSNVLIS
ncbi:hypothetical protein CANINC_003043 [Pichia inconspicua]|uniref:STAS domain-containing protein n=1 Tax=Pichia inconspicua TaxID=52247 RepID=A0A4T0WZL9_9ASCO|nr:hypothetical protein CANINC_003043 [[Candida] inconspicua]